MYKGKMGQIKGLNIEPWTPNYEQVPGATSGQAKQPYQDFGGGRLSDNDKYFSRDVLALEWERLFSKVWIIVGHLNDMPEPNCFMKVDFGRESFLVIRGEGDSVRAFYNVCQHRGTRLVKEDFGRSRSFVCPFHRWGYNSDGALAHVPGRESFREETLCRNLNLEPVKCATWKGFVFLTMDPNASSLDEYMGERFRASLDAYEFHKFIRLYDVRQTWNVNWKTAYESFIEGYHVTSLHPELCAYMDDYYVQHDAYENGNGRSIFPFMEPAQSYLREHKGEISGLVPEMKLFMQAAMLTEPEYPSEWRDVKKAVINGKRKNEKKLGFDYSKFSDDQLVDDWNLMLFPVTTFNAHPEGILFQRWWPDAEDPRKTHYILQVYAMAGECILPGYMPVSPQADRSGKKVLPITRLDGMGGVELGPVVEQDVAFIAQFQAGIESRGFRGASYGEQEIKNRQFYDEYYKYLNCQKR
jgi:phenylpropionate dioxygenase-like ring-hydroxylating dioxygenase large terminal subunit